MGLATQLSDLCASVDHSVNLPDPDVQVAGLSFGSEHFVLISTQRARGAVPPMRMHAHPEAFSTYSLPLLLAVEALAIPCSWQTFVLVISVAIVSPSALRCKKDFVVG